MLVGAPWLAESGGHGGVVSSAHQWTIGSALLALLQLVAAADGGMNHQQATVPCHSSYNSDLAVEMRQRFAVPSDGYQSCAVVGSSGLLLRQRLGRRLDGFDMVMRFNQAPLKGYEGIVGSKTTIRVVATEATKRALYCQKGLPANESVCPNYGMVLTCFWPSDIEAWQDECGNVTKPVISANDLKESPVTQKLTPWLQNPMSGATGIALALMMCPHGVDVFGYTHAGNIKFSNEIAYHYYDDRRAPSPLGRVSLPGTAKALSDFAAGEGRGCLRLDTPDTLLPSWNQSEAEEPEAPHSLQAAADPYVDPDLGACPVPPKTGILAWISARCAWCLSPGPIPIAVGAGLLLCLCLAMCLVCCGLRRRQDRKEADSLESGLAAKGAEGDALLSGSRAA